MYIQHASSCTLRGGFSHAVGGLRPLTPFLAAAGACRTTARSSLPAWQRACLLPLAVTAGAAVGATTGLGMLLWNLAACLGLLLAAVGSLAGAAATAVAAIVALAVFGITAAIAGGIGFAVCVNDLFRYACNLPARQRRLLCEHWLLAAAVIHVGTCKAQPQLEISMLCVSNARRSGQGQHCSCHKTTGGARSKGRGGRRGGPTRPAGATADGRPCGADRGIGSGGAAAAAGSCLQPAVGKAAASLQAGAGLTTWQQTVLSTAAVLNHRLARILHRVLLLQRPRARHCSTWAAAKPKSCPCMVVMVMTLLTHHFLQDAGTRLHKGRQLQYPQQPGRRRQQYGDSRRAAGLACSAGIRAGEGAASCQLRGLLHLWTDAVTNWLLLACGSTSQEPLHRSLLPDLVDS